MAVMPPFPFGDLYDALGALTAEQHRQKQRTATELQMLNAQSAIQMQQMSIDQHMARMQAMQNSLASVSGIYGVHVYQPSGVIHANTTTIAGYGGSGQGAGVCGEPAKATKATERKLAHKGWTYSKRKPEAAQPPFRLTLKNSPLFAHRRWAGMHWRFDSPFAWVRPWFERLVIRTHRRLS
jgi:hypothetical protein